MQLTVTKKSTTSPAPPADASTPKPSKKIQARATPDDGDDADQASAVADKNATGKEQAGKVSDLSLMHVMQLQGLQVWQQGGCFFPHV